MEKKPQRIQLSRKKGWRLPQNTVSVARPTKWGNPFRIGFEAKDAAEAVRKFYFFLAGSGFPEARSKMGNVGELKGKNLACWCKIGCHCHADILLAVANNWKVKLP